jgi:hypothetical protein
LFAEKNVRKTEFKLSDRALRKTIDIDDFKATCRFPEPFHLATVFAGLYLNKLYGE